MYKRAVLTAALLIAGASWIVAQADLVFWNGPIYTLETPGEQVEALATKGERIIFTGGWKDAQRVIGESTRVFDLQGKTLLPGFTDAHVHPISGGLALMGCDLSSIEHPDSVLAFLKVYAENNPEKEWVRGHNFWLASFPNGNPRKEWLDDIIPGRPVYVTSSDGHSAWVNSRALQLAGINAETPDPPNGRIERDPQTNEPTGTLREEAMALVEKLIPEYSQEELVEGLRKGLEVANSLGITNLVEASAREPYLKAYLELAEKQELTAHVNISIYGDISKGEEGVKKVLALNEKYSARLPDTSVLKPDLTFNQVKFFMDGVVEGKTAAMLTHYHGDTHGG
ncbi:MAG: amidohydrolase family protein, partial [Phaeodactylibacter sp.]|nr:amidohydrolase family protein [Phaeodactylibacter sp.]